MSVDRIDAVFVIRRKDVIVLVVGRKDVTRDRKKAVGVRRETVNGRGPGGDNYRVRDPVARVLDSCPVHTRPVAAFKSEN